MNEITIKTFLTDGTESGEMTMPIDSVLAMAQFSFFAKLCRESDEKAGTQAIETIKAEIMARIAELKNHETGEYKSELCKKDGEKLEKKLLTVCPELKQEERKLKTIEKNQLYFWTGKDRENNVKISAHLGDKYQLPGGYYAFIEKEQPHGISEKPKYRATDAICGMMIKKGSLKEVKEFLKLESTETALKNALESWRAKENAELIEKVKSGKIDRNEIEIMTNDENERFLIEMYLTDIYTNAKQAETAETETTEPTENHLEESRKEESTTTNKEVSTMNENTNAAVQATEATPETVPAVVVETTESSAHGTKWTEYLENDNQFYPTPADLAGKLVSLIDWADVKTVLEPSAGKGDLLQAVKAARKVFTWTDSNGGEQEFSEPAFKGTIDCVEIDPNLCAILQSKGYSPENADFLGWDCMKYYDAVVMNPPFRQAEKHVLKALELLKCGGQLAAIVNAETLKNPCTVYRKDLAAKLAEYSAKIEYLDGAFSEAERTTNVEIAMIYAKIPEKQCTYDYFARMDTAHTYNTGSAESAENSENTTLATNDIVENLLNSYKNEAQASNYILRKWRSISALVPELSLTYADYSLKNTAVDSDNLSKQIRLKYWKKLFLSKTVQDKLTESTRDNFQKKIDTFGKYEFNIKNIYTLLGELTENLAGDIEHDMLSLWDRLTYHSSMCKNTNIHYYNGWKTNDAYKLGGKIVWNCYCSNAYTYKKYVYYYHTFIQDIDELDKIFQYLNGGKRPTTDNRSILDIFQDSVSGEFYQGEKISFPFFDAIFYKKGTAHIMFKCPDLVKKWNIFAGRKHNFLPDDYGKECYNNLKKSQKEVVDSFEGKEQYNETHKNYAFYSGGAAVAMLGMADSTTAQPEQVQPETATAATTESTAETVPEMPEVCRFSVGAKYAYKKSYVTITGRNESMIEISVDGKTIVKNAEISDNVEIIKNSRGVTLCRADKPYTDNTPTDPTGSHTDGTESPEQSAPETIHSTTETPSEAPTEPETGKAETTVEETELLELPETKSIKFFYNGFKINGDKKITVKCSYDMDADGKTVRIYADGYGTEIPRDVFDNVKNDSDIMTDYFDKDSCTVTPEHPLFKYIQYVAAKCELRGYKANRKETYEKFITVNPGQPTAADLSKVAKYNSDRAAAAKAAAEEKERIEQEEHDRQMSELCEFSGSMVQMVCEKYPIRDGAPTVRIEWSEHPAFSDGFTMSISAAQILFSIFDEKQAKDREKENFSGAWYYKTKFVVEYTDTETGEQSSYTGRQDFGDGEGGILEHMLNHAEWERTHSGDIATYGKIIENPPETTDKLDFIKWLSQFLESSPDADGTEHQEITMQTSTGSTADGAQAQKQAIAVTFAPELQQAAEKHSENYAECKQIMNDIDTAVSALPPEDIAHILDTLPRDTLGVLMARRICQQYAKTDPANAAMLLGAWILDCTNNDGAAT